MEIMNIHPCGGKRPMDMVSGPSLAMVYSPYQEFENIYESDVALMRGTIFQDLDKPWLEGGACDRG